MSKQNNHHECEHNHTHPHNNHHEENNSKDIIFYIISIILFILGFIPAISKYKIVIYLLAVILCGFELIIEGIKNIFKLNFEEDTLMTIAVISAFILGEYPESVAVILLFKLGEFLEHKAIDKSNSNIEKI